MFKPLNWNLHQFSPSLLKAMRVSLRFWGLQARHNIRWEKNWKGEVSEFFPILEQCGKYFSN